MSAQCVSTDGASRCELERWHPGKHRAGTGAFRRTWGGKLNVGPKSASARSSAGLTPSKAPRERSCLHCTEPEVITWTEIAGRVVKESSLDGGQCKDREACLGRAPQLELGL